MGISTDERVEQLADSISKAYIADDAADYDAISEDLDAEERETRALPEHACAYCGIDDVNCVLQCLTCKRWYAIYAHIQVLQWTRENAFFPYRHAPCARQTQGCHVASGVAFG